MKKYLMMGAAALLMGASFTSCSKDKDLYDPQANAMKFLQDYQAAFISVFGQPDINQTWGFGDAAQSRVTRSVNANGNEWGSTYKVPTELTAEQKDIVRQYFQQNKIKTYEDPQWTDYFMQQVYKGHTEMDGSLSAELYTSANNGLVVGSDHMDHLAACNADGSIKDHIYNYNFGTCSTYPDILNTENVTYNSANGNYHSDEIQLMVSSTTAKFGYFNSDGSLGHTDYTSLVGWETIRTWANSKGLNGECLNDGWNRSFMGFDFEQVVGEDVYAYDVTWGNNEQNQWVILNKEIKYARYTGPAFEGYLYDGTNVSLASTDGTEYGNTRYAILTYNGKQIPYLSSEQNMYCGDFIEYTSDDAIMIEIEDPTYGKHKCLRMDVINELLSQDYYPVDGGNFKKWVKVQGGHDDYFSDWIVCLTKANPINEQPQSETKSIRIMAEDVAAAAGSDIDFNDVVFDVEATFAAGAESTNKVTITVRAAGGTMPLYIGGVEVHEKMLPGVANNTKTMINTDADWWADGENYFAQDGVAPVSFDLNVTVGKASFLSDVNSKVEVSVNNQGNIVPVLAQQGEPAAKIAVPVGTPWVREKINIGLVYSLFTDWVQNNSNNTSWYNTYDESKVMR